VNSSFVIPAAFFVIPAKAGIQAFHKRKAARRPLPRTPWVPACPGTTARQKLSSTAPLLALPALNANFACTPRV